MLELFLLTHTHTHTQRERERERERALPFPPFLIESHTFAFSTLFNFSFVMDGMDGCRYKKVQIHVISPEDLSSQTL